MRDEILEHLGYEWWMFRCAHDLLSRLHGDGDPVRNALVESMAMHGRNLAHFFHAPKRPRSDDWNIEDLGLESTPMPENLRAWCADVHTSVAHVTQARIDVFDVRTPGEIRPHLHGRIQAVQVHVGKDMPRGWIGHRATESLLLRAERWGKEAPSTTPDAMPPTSASYATDRTLTDYPPRGTAVSRRPAHADAPGRHGAPPPSG
jgi:hypothetical protein